MPVLLFIFGAAFGSFIGVIADRYQPENFLFSRKVLGGRSHCDACGVTLRWFELIPVLSFLVQRGHCRNCSARLSFKYPLVEILSGLIFALVPLKVADIYEWLGHPGLAAAKGISLSAYLLPPLWTAAFLVLLLVSIIDLRLSVIPDEANILLGILGVFVIFLSRPDFGLAQGSFLKAYALLFGWRNNIWLNHLLAALFAGAFFALIILLSRGRGMGMGDLKFAVPLGLLFGWPDIILIVGVGFVIGSIYGVWMMVKKKKGLKSLLPFGPFLAVAAAIVFFFGYEVINSYFAIVSSYFKLFSL
jgi:leader peptidase (prepilin peptidase)/N-methyltransferase